MHRRIFWTAMFLFSVMVYGDGGLKEVGKIDNFAIDPEAIIIPQKNILINPHYQGANNGFDDYKLIGIDFFDIRKIQKPKLLFMLPLPHHPLEIKLSRDNKYLFVLQDHLKIYNIEKIMRPNLVASYDVDNAGSVSFLVSPKRDYLYITKPLSKTEIKTVDANYAFYIYDVKNINNIHLVSRYNINGYISNMWISPDETKLIYNIERSDKIFPDRIGLADISDIKHIKILDESWKYSMGRLSIAHERSRKACFSKDSHYSYVALGYYGLAVYDLSRNSLNLVQRTAGRKVFRFLNRTGSVYDIEHDASYSRLFLVGYDERMKKPKRVSSPVGVKDSYFIVGRSSIAIPERRLLLVEDYDYRYPLTHIYRW